MFKSILILFTFLFSLNTFAGFTVVAGGGALFDNGATCNSFETCAAIFRDVHTDATSYVRTGTFWTGDNKMLSRYQVSNGSFLTARAYFTATPDCLMTTGVASCSLVCSSAATCLTHAANSCPDGVTGFSYTNVGNWSYGCSNPPANDPQDGSPTIDDLPDSAIQIGYAKGDRGLQGQTGASGTNGTNGTDGNDGADGIDGSDGEIGLSGSDGSDGANGIDGTNGTNGSNGLNGLDGPQGIQGIAGAAGVVDDEVLADLRNTDFLSQQRINAVEVQADSLEGSLATAESDLFTLFQKDLVLETGQALIDADVKTNDQEIFSLSAALADFVSTPPTDGIDGVDGVDGTDGIDGTDGQTGLTGAAGSDGIDGTNGLNGLNGSDGENVDTAAVVSAINTSNDFLKTSQSISANTGAFDSFSSLFGTSQIAIVEAEILSLQDDIKLENNDFLALIKAKFSFDSSSSGYQTRMLDIGTWGSYDVSLSRFAEYFGGLANIVYFFAVLFSLYIVLSGVRI
jgi:hypothetical protein